MVSRLFARRAWVEGRWQRDVLLVAGDDGCWSQVRPDCAGPERAGAQALAGPVVPALVNAHSHAFQRAMAGQAERSPVGERDDFWSWRDRMYQLALALTPDDVERIATHLYRELVAGGYSHVCEFHYLHSDGRAYAEPLDVALALVRAARSAGIGLTLLPTLYMRSGFGAAGLREEQRRFASTPDSVLRIAHAIAAMRQDGPPLRAGVAIHSLRAVDEGAMLEVAQAAGHAGWPVHIHAAEQQREVDDCLAHHGSRPIEWLLDKMPVDARWNLVHATHADVPELEALRRTGASIVLCPTTEANLADGVFDLPTWLRLGGRWSIGSDSHVCRNWVEELRLLEYSQRLARRERNVAARAAGKESTAYVLFAGALEGGSAAAGLSAGGFVPGHRAAWHELPIAEEVDRRADPLDLALFSS